jgi:LysR family glycine cleavage system transcriptional activator
MTSSPKRRVSLALLAGFEAAARTLSFTRAAQELCITQSAVSRQIKALEEQIGVLLFKRMNRGLALTDDGELLLTAAASALRLLNDSINRLDRKHERASLTIATAAPFASFWLAPRLARYLAEHPGSDIRVLPSNDPSELERIAADVGIWHFNAKNAPAGQALAVDEVLPVCSPTLLDRPGVRLSTPQDLSKQVLLQFENVVNGRRRVDWVRWLAAFELDGLEPSGTIGFAQYDQVIRAAVSGDGVALGRLPLIAPLIGDGLLHAPFPALRVSTGAWHVLVAPAARDRPDVRRFVDWCRAQVVEDAAL